MSWWTRVYAAIKNLKSPLWFQRLTENLLIHVVIPTLRKLGEMAVVDLERYIREASAMDMDNLGKLNYVRGEFRKKYSPKDIKDSVLNLGIELIYQRLKGAGLLKP